MTTLPYPYGSGTGQLLENVSVGYRTDGPLLHDGEPRTAANINRAIDAVAQNVDTIWQRMTSDYHPLAVPRTYSYTVPAGSGISGLTVPHKVFVGRSSDSGSIEIADIIAITDDDGRPLIVDGRVVTVSDILESPSGSSVFCVPTTGFYEAPYLSLSATVPSGTTIYVQYGRMSDVDSLEPADTFELPSMAIRYFGTLSEAADELSVGSIAAVINTSGDQDVVWSVSSPYDEFLLRTDGSSLVGVYATEIYYWSASSGHSVWNVDLGVSIYGSDIVAGRSAVVTAEFGDTTLVQRYSLSTGSLLGTHKSGITSDSTNRPRTVVTNGNRIMAAQYDSSSSADKVFLWDIPSETATWSYDEFDEVQCLAIGEDRGWVVTFDSASGTGLIRTVELSSGSYGTGQSFSADITSNFVLDWDGRFVVFGYESSGEAYIVFFSVKATLDGSGSNLILSKTVQLGQSSLPRGWRVVKPGVLALFDSDYVLLVTADGGVVKRQVAAGAAVYLFDGDAAYYVSGSGPYTLSKKKMTLSSYLVARVPGNPGTIPRNSLVVFTDQLF